MKILMLDECVVLYGIISYRTGSYRIVYGTVSYVQYVRTYDMYCTQAPKGAPSLRHQCACNKSYCTRMVSYVRMILYSYTTYGYRSVLLEC